MSCSDSQAGGKKGLLSASTLRVITTVHLDERESFGRLISPPQSNEMRRSIYELVPDEVAMLR
jgi:hypothetical protein